MKASLLIIVDQYGWAFDRIAQQIYRHYNRDYEIIVKTAHEAIIEKSPLRYDGVLCLWWGVTADIVQKYRPKSAIFAMYDHFTWKGNEVYARRNINAAKGIVVANRRLLGEFTAAFSFDKPVWVCEDGVDTRIFSEKPLPDKFTVCWSGNSTTAPNNLKGFNFVKEACELLDVPLITSDRANGTSRSFEQMPNFYAGASVGCFASSSEGTPNPLLELLACGRCVAITPVGLSDQVVREGITGTIIQSRSVAGVADALDRLRNMDLEKNMKRCLKVAKNYSWSKKILEWKPVFETLFGD